MKGFTIAVVGAISGFLNGLFGAGGGTVVVPSLERFAKLEPHKAHATAIAVILPLSIISLFIYFNKAEFNYWELVPIMLGGITGGIIGAKMLNKISDGMLHKIFGAFMLAAAVKMIF